MFQNSPPPSDNILVIICGGTLMVTTNSGPEKWKEEQLFYFKEYIKSFKPGSREYKQIAKGIFDLEKGR
jgi:hypothetical protein